MLRALARSGRCRSAARRRGTRRSAASGGGRRPGGSSSASTARRRRGAASTSAHGGRCDALLAVAGVELGGRCDAMRRWTIGAAADSSPSCETRRHARRRPRPRSGRHGRPRLPRRRADRARRRAGLGRPAGRPRRRHVGRLDRGGAAAGRDAARRHGAAGQPPAAVAGRARPCVRRAGLGPPRPRPEPRQSSGSIASPARLRAAVRAPWAVSPGSLAAALLPEGRVPTERHGRAVREPLRRARGRRRRCGSSPCSSTPVGASSSAGRARRPRRRPRRCGRRAPSRRSSSRPRSAASATSTAACTRRRTPTSSPPSVRTSCSSARRCRRSAARRGSARRRRCARSPGCRWPGRSPALRGRGIPVVAFQPTAADLEIMAGDSLDPRKFAPVAAAAEESTRRRLARADVRERLAALG